MELGGSGFLLLRKGSRKNCDAVQQISLNFWLIGGNMTRFLLEFCMGKSKYAPKVLYLTNFLVVPSLYKNLIELYSIFFVYRHNFL